MTDLIVIAGGLGTRLRPLTYSISKCLLPMGRGTVLSQILNEASKYGFSKKTIIGYYFFKDIMGYCHENNLAQCFIKEPEPMGTCGGLSLLRDTIYDDFFVVNCDTLTNINYSNMLKTHKENDNYITLAVYPFTHKLDYAVVYGENERVKKIREKPSFTTDFNIGIYCISPKTLDFICGKMGIDELINILLAKGLKVGYYQMTPEDEYWYDVGRSVEDYNRVKNLFMED